MERWLINTKLDREYLLEKNNLICKTTVPKELKKEFSKSRYNGAFRLYNPFLLKDMDKAVDRIDAAIKGRQRVIVFGNNGIDGILSTSIIYKALMKLGVDVSYYIPDSNSGEKGLSIGAVEYVKNLAYDVIIVVGCGINSDYEVEYAKALGMDVIIVDYNQVVLEKSDAILINPKRSDCEYPFKDLAGCGVAFKFIQALWHYYGLNGCEDFLDIVAIATISEKVPLVDENKSIIKYGFKLVSKTQRCAIKSLISGLESQDKMSSYGMFEKIVNKIDIAIKVCNPRIVVELFTTCDYYKALQIVKYIEHENKNYLKLQYHDGIYEEIKTNYDFCRCF